MAVHVVPPAFHLPLPPTFLFHVATFPPQCQTSGDPVHQPSFETALGAALSPGKKQPQAAANTTLTLLSISRVCLWLSCLEQPVQQPHECKLVFEGLVMRYIGSVKYIVTILNITILFSKCTQGKLFMSKCWLSSKLPVISTSACKAVML